MQHQAPAPRQRLDQYVIEQKPRLSRGYAARLIDDGKVLVNDKPEKAGFKIRDTDVITIDFDEASLDVVESIALPIIYEDDDVLVINKPTGVISHARGRYWDEASVASFVREHVLASGQDFGFEVEPADGQPVRGGIVHRLDRATSGVMVCAKNQAALSWLQKQFAARNVKKSYSAVITGQLDPEAALIDLPIERNPKAPATFRVGANGKASQTAYSTVRTNETHSLLELKPLTGRTHQLRVHLQHLGHPIVGDQLYNGEAAERLLLHAHTIELTMPSRERMTFESPLPAVFNQFVA